MTATAIAPHRPEPAEDPDELDAIRRELDAIVPADDGLFAGAAEPEPAPEPDPDHADRIRKLANEMAAQYRKGVPLVRIATNQHASIAWVRRTVADHSDWDIPELDTAPAVNIPAPKPPVAHRGTRGPRTPKSDKRERNRLRAVDMGKALTAGLTLDEIGERFGITRERVRQLINEFNDQTVPQIIRQRRAEELARAQARWAADTEQVQAWSQANPGSPVEDVARLIGRTATEVGRMLGGRRNLHTHSRTGNLQKWTDEQLLGYVRRYHAETGRTDGPGFDEWSRRQDGPSKQSFMFRFRRWNTALTKAGVAVAKPRLHQARYEKNDLWSALVEYLGQDRDDYTLRGYEDWAKSRPGVPSGALLRIRLGEAWVAVRNKALDVTAHPEHHNPAWVADITTRRDWARFCEGSVCREQAVAHVRDAIAELGPDLPSLGYQRWANTNGRPALDTLLRNAHLSWSEIVAAAGGNPRPPYRAPRTRTEVLKAVQEYLAAHPGGKCDEYKRWASANGRPSLSTVTKHFDTWTNARRTATEKAG